LPLTILKQKNLRSFNKEVIKLAKKKIAKTDSKKPQIRNKGIQRALENLNFKKLLNETMTPAEKARWKRNRLAEELASIIDDDILIGQAVI